MTGKATLTSLGLAGLEHRGPAPAADLAIEGLAVDSRDVKPGYLFAALTLPKEGVAR